MAAKDSKPKQSQKSAPKTKGKVGRPRKEVDYKLVYELRKIGCTDEEMAPALGVSIEWMRQRKAADPDFLDAYEKGWQELKRSLRRRMIEVANSNERNAATMLIWLSKNILGWTDRQEFGGKGGGPIEVKVVYGREREAE